MQVYGLTVDKFLDHAARWSGDRPVVEAKGGLACVSTNYASVRERGNRLSGALATLGLRHGDRVATLAWNTCHHLELYYAAMGAGLVCHTLNPRLSVAHLVAMIEQAADRILAVAADLLPLWTDLAPRCPSIEQVIILDTQPPLPDPAAHPARLWHYEALLAAHGEPARWGDFAEESAAGLCYTSGTTGAPKGVVYTHRSNYLHTMRALQADAIGLGARDSVLVAVPMFHANGWGLPFAAPAAGAKLVLPGRQLDGASLFGIMQSEAVSVAVGVQTAWIGLADHIEQSGETLPALERVLIGGSHCPNSLIQRLEQTLDCEVQTSWGMTELSPIGTIAPRGLRGAARRAAGRPAVGVDIKLTDAAGATLVDQRGVLGHLKVRGHSVVDRYYESTDRAVDADGWFETGDLAMIDAGGDLTICGRAKDLIKSGGEWINPTEIEAIVGRHPAVRQVAVIARSDPRWGERPVLIVEADDEVADAPALLSLLRGQVADWWVPDQVAHIIAMPLAASGKIDKNRLRSDFAEGRIAARRVAG